MDHWWSARAAGAEGWTESAVKTAHFRGRKPVRMVSLERGASGGSFGLLKLIKSLVEQGFLEV